LRNKTRNKIISFPFLIPFFVLVPISTFSSDNWQFNSEIDFASLSLFPPSLFLTHFLFLTFYFPISLSFSLSLSLFHSNPYSLSPSFFLSLFSLSLDLFLTHFLPLSHSNPFSLPPHFLFLWNPSFVFPTLFLSLYKLPLYCKLVKVRTLCILCNNWCLFCLWSLTPVRLGVTFIHSLSRVSSPRQTDCLHTK